MILQSRQMKMNIINSQFFTSLDVDSCNAPGSILSTSLHVAFTHRNNLTLSLYFTNNTNPYLPVHSTRSFAQLLCCKLYTVIQKYQSKSTSAKAARRMLMNLHLLSHLPDLLMTGRQFGWQE